MYLNYEFVSFIIILTLSVSGIYLNYDFVIISIFFFFFIPSVKTSQLWIFYHDFDLLSHNFEFFVSFNFNSIKTYLTI